MQEQNYIKKYFEIWAFTRRKKYFDTGMYGKKIKNLLLMPEKTKIISKTKTDQPSLIIKWSLPKRQEIISPNQAKCIVNIKLQHKLTKIYVLLKVE